MASMYDMLKKTADEDEFFFNIKKKIESLLIKIINSDEYLKCIIKINVSYYVDDALLYGSSEIHSHYSNGTNMDGTFYTGYNNNPFEFETWFYDNFTDYSQTVDIYQRFLSTRNCAHDDLELLNGIYEKYE
jgi:hypothetical protein